MIKNLKFALFVFAAVMISQCQSKPNEPDIYEGMDARTKVRMRQYMVQGKMLYQMHCQNCHGVDGKGLGKLIPPVAKSDYLMNDIPRSICVIKNGQQDSIVVNGIQYQQIMPAAAQLTDLEIAEITTFITNSWGNKSKLWEVKETSRILQTCNENLGR